MNSTEIIEAFGGSGAVARICDVSVGAVSQWKTNGIPKSRLMYLQLAKPELFEVRLAPQTETTPT